MNRRINLIPTYRCNTKCRFCFLGSSHHKKGVPLEKLKKKLRKAKRLRIHSVDLTGGEPTVYPGLPQLIAYAKRLGYKDIGIITNGLRLSDRDYFRSLIDAGLSNMVFTLLGPDDKTHDKITARKGSYDKLMRAIANAGSLGFPFRINVVVTKDNYASLPDIAKKSKNLKPFVFNLLMYMFCDDIRGNRQMAARNSQKYSLVAPYLKKAIDICPAQEVNVRHIPFCLMQGYEKHVCNMHQIHHDRHEWDYHVQDILSNGRLVNAFHTIVGFAPERRKLSVMRKGLDHLQHKAIINYIERQIYVKAKACKSCKYSYKCEGVWKGYAELFGTEELGEYLEK